MTARPDIDDATAARYDVPRRILFSLVSCERLLGLPQDIHAQLEIRDRCERILRRAQRGGLATGLYSLVWSLFQATRADGAKSEVHP